MIKKSGQTCFDNVPGALFLTDAKSKVVYASTGIKERTGFSVPEVVGVKPGSLWGGQMSEAFYKQLWQTIEAEKRMFVGSIINRTKVGTRHQEDIHIVPVTIEDTNYFMEIHPHLDTSKTEQRFQQEFRMFFSEDKVQAQSFIDWVLPWLGGSPFQTSWDTFEDLLLEECIYPMQLQFSERVDDAFLVQASKQDTDAFQSLYRKYWDTVFSYFLRRVSDQVSAEELAQETFVRALKYLPQFRVKNASYKTYLLRVSHNLLVNFYRKKREVPLDDVCDMIADFNSGHDPIMHERIWSGISYLGAAEQEIFWLRYHEELSIHEIAILVQKSENAVKLHLSRGRMKLKKMLDNR